MKSILKLLIIGLCLFCSVSLFSQDQNRYLRKARFILRSDKSSLELKQRAWSELHVHANNDSVGAMYALGVLYKSGIEAINLQPDYAMSRSWYEKAAAKGHLRSINNLGMFYYLGLGVEQNFETAFRYAKKAAESGESLFVHRLGHFYERGYGCEQSYEKALKCCRYAAEKNLRGAMYTLGLYYRNGYGVERDTAVANFWFEKAKQLGHPLPDIELADMPERPLEVIPMDKVPKAAGSKKRKSTSREHVKHAVGKSDYIGGEYTGAIITYDWSGQYPLRENFLDVTFEQSGSELIVKWVEEYATEVEARATLTDSVLIFHEATYTINNMDDRQKQRTRKDLNEWDFVNAALSYVNENGQVILSGNLRLRNHLTKEPGRPTYLVLQRKQPQLDTDTINDPAIEVTPETNNPVFVSHVLVYPNPFADHLTLSFSLEQQSPCEINVYSVSGVLVFKQRLGMLEPGIHRYQMNTSHYTNGIYILTLICGDQVSSQTIIK